MGWKAFYKDGTILSEEFDGRPVQAGEEGKLALITQEDYGNKIALDLINGVIIIGYDSAGTQNGSVEIANPGFILYICDETNMLSEIFDVDNTPDAEGWYTSLIIPLEWRPIWFTRMSNAADPVKVIGLQTTLPVKVIGVQTTLPENFGGKNIKKLISLFSTGKIGID